MENRKPKPCVNVINPAHDQIISQAIGIFTHINQYPICPPLPLHLWDSDILYTIHIFWEVLFGGPWEVIDIMVHVPINLLPELATKIVLFRRKKHLLQVYDGCVVNMSMQSQKFVVQARMRAAQVHAEKSRPIHVVNILFCSVS